MLLKKGNQLVTDLYVKPTDTDQCRHSILVHISHFEKLISFIQALHLNRTGSENAIFDKRCNELEVWLK